MGVTWSHHMTKSHKECGKIVHRPCSSCISSVQKMNEDSIEFSLSTWRVIKSSRLSCYNYQLRVNEIIRVRVSKVQGRQCSK